jgi:DNA-binding transcriptional regulator LsrR (DeoR family)
MGLDMIEINEKKERKQPSQLRTVNHYLYHHTASRFMLAVNTGIPIQNVCRYIEALRKHNQVAVVRHDRCEVSGERVEFLTTNPAKFPRDGQLKLFPV